MIRRTLLAALAAALLGTALPADAGTAKLYLNQLSADCSAAAEFAITTSAADEDSCVYVPRVLVDGQGLDSTAEAFATSRKMKSFRLDASKPVTGTFQVFGAGALQGIDAAAYVKAEFRVKVAKKTLGTVVVEGPAAPTAPATKSFSFKLPAGLNRVTTNSVSVDVTWVTCVGLCGVKVSGASFLTVPTR